MLPVTSINGSVSIRVLDVLNVILDTPFDVMATALAGKNSPVVGLVSVVIIGEVAVPLDVMRSAVDTNTVVFVMLNLLMEPVLKDILPPPVVGLKIPVVVSDAKVKDGVDADPLDRYLVDA